MRKKKIKWDTSLITGGKPVKNTAIVISEQSSSPPAESRSKAKSRYQKIANDRWENPVSGYGMAGYDPVASTVFERNASLDLFQIDHLYEYDWLAGRIIEALVDAALQKGFTIKNDKNPEGAIEVAKLLKQWKTKTHTKHLGYQSRQYGGAAKINYINDGLPSAFPVNWKMIKSVDQSKICGRFYCRPHIFHNDPTNLKTFKTPWIYQVFDVGYYGISATNAGSHYQLHADRLSWLDGSYLPDHLKIKNWGAGNSILVRVNEALRAYGSSIQSLSATIQDFVTKVLKIQDMDDLLEENEEELNFRIRMADAKSNLHGTSVIGEGEDLFKISTPITGLPQSIVILMDTVSAAAHTPKSKLFGNLTGTLGSSSGKYDRSNWDNQVETYQNEQLTPVIEDDVRLACAILEYNYEDFEVNWPDVTETGEKETAQTRKLNAEAYAIEIKNEEALAGNGE